MSDENKYSIGIASGYYTETEVAELEAEIAHLTAERGRLRERMSNHCCCEFAADGETFVKRCKVHADIARERDKLREALAFYSQESNYQPTGWQGDMDPAPVNLDGGKLARGALKETTLPMTDHKFGPGRVNTRTGETEVIRDD